MRAARAFDAVADFRRILVLRRRRSENFKSSSESFVATSSRRLHPAGGVSQEDIREKWRSGEPQKRDQRAEVRIW